MRKNKRWVVIVAGVLLAVFIGGWWVLTRQSAPGLDNPEELTLFSIDGRDRVSGQPPPAGETFHGYPILGKSEISDAEAQGNRGCGGARDGRSVSEPSSMLLATPWAPDRMGWPIGGLRDLLRVLPTTHPRRRSQASQDDEPDPGGSAEPAPDGSGCAANASGDWRREVVPPMFQLPTTRFSSGG